MSKQYWLMKSEPSVFSIDDLIKTQKQITGWEGVRNYQARNMIRDCMKVGDFAFFYHSNATPPGIVGVVEICQFAYPDETQFDPHSHYYDPKSVRSSPRWYQVDVKFVEKFSCMITLDELKKNPALAKMPLVQKGNRLSVMPVTQAEWNTIMTQARGVRPGTLAS